MSAVNSTPDDPQEQDSKFLIFEWPIALYPALARILGSVDDAIVLQQIRYWTEQPAMGKLYKGRRWVRNSIHQWCIDNFYFWSEDTVARILDRLRDLGVIDTEKLNTSKFDQTLWYAINFKRLNELADESGIQDWLNDRFLQKHGIDSAIPQNALMQESEIHDRKSADSSIQTTSENTKDSSANKSRSTKPRAKKSAKENPSSVYTTEIKNKLSEVCFGRIDAWKTDASGLGKALRELSKIESDLSVDKLAEFELRWKKNDWRWKQHQQHPKPYEIVPAWLQYMPAEGSNSSNPIQTTDQGVEYDIVFPESNPVDPSHLYDDDEESF